MFSIKTNFVISVYVGLALWPFAQIKELAHAILLAGGQELILNAPTRVCRTPNMCTTVSW